MFAASQTFESGYAAGYYTAGVVAVIVPLALAVVCFRAARHPEANRRSLQALAILMSGCAFMGLALNLSKFAGVDEPILGVVAVLVLLIVVLVSSVLAVVGLDQATREKTTFWRGRGPALVSLVLVVALSALTALAYRQSKQGKQVESEQTKSPR